MVKSSNKTKYLEYQVEFILGMQHWFNILKSNQCNSPH